MDPFHNGHDHTTAVSADILPRLVADRTQHIRGALAAASFCLREAAKNYSHARLGNPMGEMASVALPRGC